MKTEDGIMLVEKEAVKERWAEYFEGLLNVEEDRKSEIVAVGRENGGKVLGQLKAGKAAGLDECTVEC